MFFKLLSFSACAMSLDDVTFLVAGWKFLPALQVEFIELISSMKLSDRMWFSPLSKMPNVHINSSKFTTTISRIRHLMAGASVADPDDF